MQLAQKKGILIISAAGNEKSNIDQKENHYFPASYASVNTSINNIISVMAHDDHSNPISSSNWGALSVDISAPGKDIVSTLKNGSWNKLSGTSQGTAFVTGVCALILSLYPSLTPIDLKNIISYSGRTHTKMKNKNRTQGLLDATRALEYASFYQKIEKVAQN